MSEKKVYQKYKLRASQGKGDSWKRMSLDELRRLLFREIKEYEGAVMDLMTGTYKRDNELDELKDIINFCHMIGARLQ